MRRGEKGSLGEFQRGGHGRGGAGGLLDGAERIHGYLRRFRRGRERG